MNTFTQVFAVACGGPDAESLHQGLAEPPGTTRIGRAARHDSDMALQGHVERRGGGDDQGSLTGEQWSNKQWSNKQWPNKQCSNKQWAIKQLSNTKRSVK